MLNKDTVEEFWDRQALDLCRQQARNVRPLDFSETLSRFLGAAGEIFLAKSARDALRQFLEQSITRKSKKRKVLVCAFNCRVIADAIVQAGLQVDTFDLSNISGFINWEKIANNLKYEHAAVIVPHFFGVPSDFRWILQRAKELDVVIIEDCAMMLGGFIGEDMAGTIGDANIFSFNYDKPISLAGGGALLINNPRFIGQVRLDCEPLTIEKEEEELELFTRYIQLRRMKIREKEAFSSRFLRRARRRLRINRNMQESRKRFPVSGFGPLRSALGIWQLEKYPTIVDIRNKNAKLFERKSTYRSWHVDAISTPAWLKQKILIANPEKGREESQKLQSSGLRVGNFNWPITINKYMGFEESPNSLFMAQYGIDVPIHQNMTEEDFEVISDVINAGFEK